MDQVRATIEGAFPNLIHTHYEITSPATPSYNCIAWAAKDTQRWWWPGLGAPYYWPTGSPTALVVASFIQAFRGLGYEVCPSADLEEGFEKVAIYALNTEPKHSARQLPDGQWTSKLGGSYDIKHATLESVEGNAYGVAVEIMKRAAIG